MERQNENDEIEIDLLEFLEVVLRHWLKVTVSAVLLAIIVFVYNGFIVTKQYASTATFYVLSKSTSITSFTDIQIGNSLATDYMLVVGSRPVLDTVIDKLDLNMEYEELEEKLSFNNPADSRMLEITATDPDPKKAKKIADAVADEASSYIAKKMDQAPPNVIQYGYIDEEPVSPNTVRNTILAGIFGAALAVALLFINYILHETIMKPEDLERKADLQVIGSIPWEGDAREAVSSSKHNRKKGKGK